MIDVKIRPAFHVFMSMIPKSAIHRRYQEQQERENGDGSENQHDFVSGYMIIRPND